MYMYVNQSKANGGSQGRQKKLNCPERDLNLRSLAFMHMYTQQLYTEMSDSNSETDMYEITNVP